MALLFSSSPIRREIHVKRLTAVDSAGHFAHPCRLCPLAFRSADDLALHLAGHSRLESSAAAAAKVTPHQSCVLCAASVPDLRSHLEEVHLQPAAGQPTDKVSCP